ncbi:CopD family protein (plasmid) [Paenibacillus urinalis]|uniref:CopD family protein n=1 Tax=Paenibacillus urinalis TaxID=521520 RepID=A0AAX3N6J7_9BACL|nr:MULTISPECIES: CopD family protein [Paenibacillus]MCM3131061.1 CopD family protein [Paenibacillus sp. MER 78]WDH85340.1 CopD family protein [Paenibacillus urinalis]WDH95220.1 CopD family protein [Paenibacillus urinalis]WDI05303.1 CopD family protein [Paenibacillus urinalis]
MSWYWLGEPFLYSCLSVLFGGVIVSQVHKSVKIPNKVFILAALGVAIFSFLPVLRIILFFSDDASFGLIFKNVMLSFAEGKAYIWTLILTVLLISVLVARKGKVSTSSNILLFVLIVSIVGALSWSSHASSYFGPVGFWPQFIHLFSVAVWAGILIIAGMYMSNKAEEWKSFLSWYHPLAIVIMLIIIISGLLLNIRTDPNYFNSWVTSYGQSLLLKHLLIIPLLFIAFFNGFLIRKKLNNSAFNPRKWVTVEGIFILLIFTVTGFMNQQVAPHDLDPQMMALSASRLYLWLADGEVQVPVDFDVSLFSLVLYVIALVSIVWMYIIFRKNNTAYAALICGLIFAIVSFIGSLTLVS